jgi:ribosomal protein S27E
MSMAHWNPDKVECRNCTEQMRHVCVQDNGEHVLWCPACGALLTANERGPISLSDWRVPRLNELNLTGNRTSRRAG